MRGGTLLIVVTLLLASVPAAAFYVPPAGPFLTRGPISITSNAGFTAANGVVGGTGSLADPYVIAGWAIYSGGGAAISIRNVTAAFVIRDNQLEGALGVEVRQTPGPGVVTNNAFLVRGTGVYVLGAHLTIRDNSFIKVIGSPNTIGVHVAIGGSLITSNHFNLLDTAIYADRGSVQIEGNRIHLCWTGILVTYSTSVDIEDNLITDANLGINVRYSVDVLIEENDVINSNHGAHIWWTQDADLVDNEFNYTMVGVAVLFESVSGNFTGNVVVNGRADGVHIWHSPLLMMHNRIENNLGVGLLFSMSTSNVTANVISHNGVGISLMGDDVPVITANVFVENIIGLDIPYASRQAVLHLSGNVVNGVAIDAPGSRVYHYLDANVTITGQVRDSGFGAGLYGSLTAQGGVVLYDVDTATISNSVISHHQIGVYAVNSFNVVIEGSALLSNQVGVRAESRAASGFHLPCALSVKGTNITIPIDPVATIGVDLRSCLGFIINSTVSNVDVGISVDSASYGAIDNVTVRGTRIGLDVSSRSTLNVKSFVAADNQIGARFSGTTVHVTGSRFEANTEAGVRLDAGATLDARGSVFRLNGHGLVDARPCMGANTCAGLTGVGNVFSENRGLGLQVNGTLSLTGDQVLRNGLDGLRSGTRATLRAVVAEGNLGNGATLAGEFRVEGGTFTNNTQGIRLDGTGHLQDARISANTDAGLRLGNTRVTALRLNVSSNFVGIAFDETLPAPPTLSVPALLAPVDTNTDVLDIHLSRLVGNQRDAIRAGSAIVNATHNYFGPNGPVVNVADQLGAFQNGVSPTVRHVPYWTDEAMTTTGPLRGL